MGQTSDGHVDAARAWRDPDGLLALPSTVTAASTHPAPAELQRAFAASICAALPPAPAASAPDTRRCTVLALEARCVAFWVLDSPARRKMDPFQRMVEWDARKETPLAVLHRALARSPVNRAARNTHADADVAPILSAIALLQPDHTPEEPDVERLSITTRNLLVSASSSIEDPNTSVSPPATSLILPAVSLDGAPHGRAPQGTSTITPAAAPAPTPAPTPAPAPAPAPTPAPAPAPTPAPTPAPAPAPTPAPTPAPADATTATPPHPPATLTLSRNTTASTSKISLSSTSKISLSSTTHSETNSIAGGYTGLDPSLAEWIASAPEPPPAQRPNRNTKSSTTASAQPSPRTNSSSILNTYPPQHHSNSAPTGWPGPAHRQGELSPFTAVAAGDSETSPQVSDRDHRLGPPVPLGLNGKFGRSSAPAQMCYREWKKFGVVARDPHRVTFSESPRVAFENRIAALFPPNPESRVGAAMAGAAFRALLPYITEQDRFQLEHVAENSANPGDFLLFLAKFGSFMVASPGMQQSIFSTPSQEAGLQQIPVNLYGLPLLPESPDTPSAFTQDTHAARRPPSNNSDWAQAEPFMYSNSNTSDSPNRTAASGWRSSSTSPFPFENSVWKSPGPAAAPSGDRQWGATADGSSAAAASEDIGWPKEGEKGKPPKYAWSSNSPV